MSLDELQSVLDAAGPLPSTGRTLRVSEDLWPAMRRTVAHVFCCALSQHFAPPPPSGSFFELFGLDFMVDGRGRVLLIEANTGPALCKHGRVLEHIIPRLIEETFQKAVDTTFPPPDDATPPALLDRFELVELPPSPLMGWRAAAPHATPSTNSTGSDECKVGTRPSTTLVPHHQWQRRARSAPSSRPAAR